jgi:hypothetical protein
MMAEGFYRLPHFEKVGNTALLKIPRAQMLAEAAAEHRDYQVLGLLSRHIEGSPRLECIVVEVTCDGVPPKNRHGIRYKERLALLVLEDESKLVEVLALRRDFPTLMHQNAAYEGTPANLCLYFGPVAAALRTWTPQNFLRRIQFWIEKSSKDELHAADQPVEQLFFVSKFELVLPWNFDELRKSSRQRFVVYEATTRSDDALTICVGAAAPDEAKDKRAIVPIELTVNSVLHGHIERSPRTLGGLADVLLSRGADLVAGLKSKIEARLTDQGITKSADEKFTIILLYVPIVRELGTDPERYLTIGFYIPVGTLTLGEQIGALFFHDGKYYRATGLLDEEKNQAWRAKDVFQMEVLRFPSKADARAQSGIADTGPVGTLIGAGSLGSAMLNLWTRAGWGEWMVVDKDHVKPHNLVRHTAFAQHIGRPKSEVVAELTNAAMQDANNVSPLVHDACDLTNESVGKAIKSCSLVVDASTTLEYPRQVSSLDNVARHVTVFITPDGDSAALMAEDQSRAIRLRTLEAQYYRAILESAWGQRHLKGNQGTFWSGASCRDISAVLPYSRIMAHAANLAEQIQKISSASDATLQVWERNPETGSITTQQIPVFPEVQREFYGLKLHFDKGLEAKLQGLRQSNLPNETGGILLGYYDLTIKAVFIVDALPAPPDSKSSPVSFERGLQGMKDTVEEASRRTAGIVGYVGEWHSHPAGHSADPSRDDIFQLAYLAVRMADDGLPAVSLIVGDGEIAILKGEAIA